MFRSFHTLRNAGLFVLALFACPMWAGAADGAGVVGFRNDTNQVISIQTTLEMANGKTKRSKPQLLFPGEVAIDSVIGTGTRRIVVTDPKKPNAAPLFEQKKLINDDLFYSVLPETVMNVKNPPVPKVKLVEVPLPIGPNNPGPNSGSGSKPGGGGPPKKP